VAQVMNVDLIIMVSTKITSSIKVHGSITRKVIDSANKSVLVIHEQKQKYLLILLAFGRKNICLRYRTGSDDARSWRLQINVGCGLKKCG
jgi:hypothetical protein